jgi:hypothetical protein
VSGQIRSFHRFPSHMLLAHADINSQGLSLLEQFIWRSVQSFGLSMCFLPVAPTSFTLLSCSLHPLHLRLHHPHTHPSCRFYRRYKQRGHSVLENFPWRHIDDPAFEYLDFGAYRAMGIMQYPTSLMGARTRFSKQ